MAMVMISPPAALPVTLAQAKQHLKIENTDDDQLINDLIEQAATYIQNISGLRLITQSWRLFFDGLPAGGVLCIPIAPVISAIEVRYFDELGDTKTVSSIDYQLDIHSSPARLWIKNPIFLGKRLNGLEVDILVGFGESGIDVPGDLLRAIMITIAHWYEFRGAVAPAGQPISLPTGLDRLLAPHMKAKL